METLFHVTSPYGSFSRNLAGLIPENGRARCIRAVVNNPRSYMCSPYYSPPLTLVLHRAFLIRNRYRTF